MDKIKTIKAPEPKSLLPWFILIVALVVGKNIIGLIKSIFGGLNQSIVGETETGLGSGTSQNEIIVEKEELSYPENNYLMWADQLEGAFYATYLTEDDELIGKILKYMKNDTDVAFLTTKYGIRDGGHWFNTNYNLPQAVGAYLDDSIKNAVNLDYQKKGITYRF